MEKNLSVSRRNLLKISLGTVGAMAGSSFIGKALAASGILTPPQTSGPFYPEDPVLRGNNDNDLTRVFGHSGQARGTIIYIEGQVKDINDQPLSNAVVDIWQANSEGRYNHSLDRNNPHPLDPNFQSRGICITDIEGRYNFKSVIPGAYPADPTWMRPSHVHFRVSRLGYRELSTQMYFKGSQYLDQDKIYMALTPVEREAVLVEFKERVLPTGEKIQFGNFPIVIQKL